MAWNDYIEQNPDILMGKPVFKGTRLAVEAVLERLGQGWSNEDLIEAFPRLTLDHIRAAFAYAAASLSSERTILMPESAA